jgi:hypothetical protein
MAARQLHPLQLEHSRSCFSITREPDRRVRSQMHLPQLAMAFEGLSYVFLGELMGIALEENTSANLQ